MIEIISGTNRANNLTHVVANKVKELYDEAGAESQILDLRDVPNEIFHPDAYASKPAAFAPYQDRILKSDGLHVVIPEYNGSFPGAVKLFIDMLKFPESFEHRPVCYTGLSAGKWGSIRGVEQLQLVFNYRNAYNLPHRVWIPSIYGALNESKSELVDEEILGLLKDQIRHFVVFVGENKNKAVKEL